MADTEVFLFILKFTVGAPVFRLKCEELILNS